MASHSKELKTIETMDSHTEKKSRMWANAKRDGRPDEYRCTLTPTTIVPCSNAANKYQRSQKNPRDALYQGEIAAIK